VGDALPDPWSPSRTEINELRAGTPASHGVIDALLALLEHEVYPLISAQVRGSIGDLRLAHLSTVLPASGEVRGAARCCRGRRLR